MVAFPYVDLRACADLRVLLARELANARLWRREFTEAKAHSAEAITSSRKLMAELDAPQSRARREEGGALSARQVASR